MSKNAAAGVKRVALELGGKSPNLIFRGVDLPEVIEVSVSHCFENSGQSCDAPTRMLVECSIYDVYYNRASKGGHFTAWEEPELFDGEIRAAFKLMR